MGFYTTISVTRVESIANLWIPLNQLYTYVINTCKYSCDDTHILGPYLPQLITKLPESGEQCGNITEFRVAKDHLSPHG